MKSCFIWIQWELIWLLSNKKYNLLWNNQVLQNSVFPEFLSESISAILSLSIDWFSWIVGYVVKFICSFRHRLFDCLTDPTCNLSLFGVGPNVFAGPNMLTFSCFAPTTENTSFSTFSEEICKKIGYSPFFFNLSWIKLKFHPKSKISLACTWIRNIWVYLLPFQLNLWFSCLGQIFK